MLLDESSSIKEDFDKMYLCETQYDRDDFCAFIIGKYYANQAAASSNPKKSLKEYYFSHITSYEKQKRGLAIIFLLAQAPTIFNILNTKDMQPIFAALVIIHEPSALKRMPQNLREDSRLSTLATLETFELRYMNALVSFW